MRLRNNHILQPKIILHSYFLHLIPQDTPSLCESKGAITSLRRQTTHILRGRIQGVFLRYLRNLVLTKKTNIFKVSIPSLKSP